MRLLLQLVSLLISIALFNTITTTLALSKKSKQLIEAGCKHKFWWKGGKYWDESSESHRNLSYDWHSSGILLTKGACVDYDYQPYFVPEKGMTKVYSTIETPKVRGVDENEGTVSIEFTLTMRWLDPNIKTNFSSDNNEHQERAVNPRRIGNIWEPDWYIPNLRDYNKRFQIKSFDILTNDEFSQEDAIQIPKTRVSKTAVKLRYGIKSTVYCNFDHSAYPMDDQTCNLTMGSGSFGAIFVLYDKSNISHGEVTYETKTFETSITFFDEKLNNGNNTVGMKIKLSRIVNSFILKYYIPCMAIVLISELSFVIPLTAIPGRVALLVTQFLTLINLFIYQQVSGLPFVANGLDPFYSSN